MAHSPFLLLPNLQGFWPSLLAMITCFIIMIKALRNNFIENYSNKQKPKLPPGPKPWPIVGNLPEMLANKPAHKWIHNLMKEMNTEIACIRLGNAYVIPVTCPTIASEFLENKMQLLHQGHKLCPLISLVMDIQPPFLGPLEPNGRK